MLTKEQLALHHDVMKDAQGRYRTTSLFWELRRAHTEDKWPPMYSIREKDRTIDGIFYPSLKKIYMSYDHIPGFEYDFALDVFGSWEQWTVLCSEIKTGEYIKQWREERDIKIKADALKMIMVAAKKDDPAGYGAAKYLAEKGYEPKESARGRPSKAEVERQKKQEAAVNRTLSADMERLGLKVVNK